MLFHYWSPLRVGLNLTSSLPLPREDYYILRTLLLVWRREMRGAPPVPRLGASGETVLQTWTAFVVCQDSGGKEASAREREAGPNGITAKKIYTHTQEPPVLLQQTSLL